MTRHGDTRALVLPSTLLAEVEAIADRTHRAVADIVREALQSYLQEPPLGVAVLRRTATEAAERMRKRRERHRLPDGVSLQDLMTDGRA